MVVFLGIGIANAQEKKPTLEETVEYINEIFEDGTISIFSENAKYGNIIKAVKVDLNGKATFYSDVNTKEKVPGTFSIFDFEKLSNSFPSDIVYLKNKQEAVLVFFGLFPLSQMPKLEKALNHLKIVCIKEKDLFD